MKQGIKKTDQEFQKRLAGHMDELRWLYMELYDNGSMFAELCDSMYAFYRERSSTLKSRDRKREEYQYLYGLCYESYFGRP